MTARLLIINEFMKDKMEFVAFLVQKSRHIMGSCLWRETS
jgi:hypothetical protein